MSKVTGPGSCGHCAPGSHAEERQGQKNRLMSCNVVVCGLLERLFPTSTRAPFITAMFLHFVMPRSICFLCKQRWVPMPLLVALHKGHK